MQEGINKEAATHGFYFEHVAEWLQQKDNKNILYVTYEDMSGDLPREIKRIEAFLNLDIGEEMRAHIAGKSTFSYMQQNEKSNYSWIVGPILTEKTFLRKGKVGDWINYLTEKQSKEIEGLVKEHLLPLGAKIRYTLT